MRILKIALVIAFSLTVAAQLIPSRLMAFAAGWPKDQNRKAAQQKADKNAAPADADQYIGSTACAECHTDIAAFFSVTAHRKTLNSEGPVDRHGCEACHGPAKKHVEYYQAAQNLAKDGKDDELNKLYADEARAEAARMRSFAGLSASAASAVCLKCHEGTEGRNGERFNFRRSEHFRHGVSCLDCHSSHSPKRTEFLLRATEPEGCYKCHAEQKTSFARPFHHKVPEGGMKCSDCHNQHGSFVENQLRTWASGEVNCVKCHTDKAGPFVYEHAPIKTEGCQACHTPHGSTNPRLLKRNEVRFLCLECHSNVAGAPAEQGAGPATPSFHNLSQTRFQNCTTCHVMIHGSNASSTYFR
ncbi:MAG: DmsE family decaheme c-type cytochrome [Blastocatellia bacterium]|nr:DmsE family decaheme c-type cytochrome [Blastocatellia bacterium]